MGIDRRKPDNQRPKPMRQLIIDCLTEAKRQLFQAAPERAGRLIFSRYTYAKMREYALTEADIQDVFAHGEAVKANMLIRTSATFTIGLIYRYDITQQAYIILTCWKRKRGEKTVNTR
jgi:hypothetical protein